MSLKEFAAGLPVCAVFIALTVKADIPMLSWEFFFWALAFAFCSALSEVVIKSARVKA